MMMINDNDDDNDKNIIKIITTVFESKNQKVRLILLQTNIYKKRRALTGIKGTIYNRGAQ